MRAFDIALTSIVLILTLGVAREAIADSEDAMCEFRKDGDTVNNKSGWCSVSQRHGYVSIDLRNGTSWELRPTDSANRYRDQEGNRVVRSNQGSDDVYKWDNKKIVVSFPRGYTLANSSHSGGSSYANWRERSTGRCVTVRTNNGRYQSIVTVPEADCQR